MLANKHKQFQTREYLVDGHAVTELRSYSQEITEEGKIREKFKLTREYHQDLKGNFKITNSTYHIGDHPS